MGLPLLEAATRTGDGLEEGPEISHIFFNLVLAISAAFDYAFCYAASV